MGVVAYIGVFPLGGMLFGYLADALTLQTSLLLAGGACVLVTLFIFFFVSIPGEKETRGPSSAFVLNSDRRGVNSVGRQTTFMR